MCRGLQLWKGTEQGVYFSMATKDMLRRREIVCPIGVFDERQVISLPGKFVGRDQACERGAEDDDRLCGWGGHENRERSQIPAAIARR